MDRLPLEQMTTQEKLEAMEALWRDLSSTPENLVSPSWHADVLQARDARVRAGKARFVDWGEAKRSLLDESS
jgi:hypothetical protein